MRKLGARSWSMRLQTWPLALHPRDPSWTYVMNTDRRIYGHNADSAMDEQGVSLAKTYLIHAATHMLQEKDN